MARENTAEIITGGAVLAIAVGFFLYAGQISGLSKGGISHTYWASFRSVEGIAVGTDVRLAGVKVGSVSAMELNAETFRADTHIDITNAITLPDDTAVIIASEGLLGGSFVELLPGGSPFNLEPGDEIEDTQSSISLLNLLMKFVSGGGDSE